VNTAYSTVGSTDRTTPTLGLRFLYRLLGIFCFNRISIEGAERLPAMGPVLYLGLHRNGAVDAIPYLMSASHATYLVSAQLHRTVLGRRIFRGIAVSRHKDRNRGIHADNAEALHRCVAHLRAGGQLFVFPEGTSSLGPRHLDFRPGAARITSEAVNLGVPLTVVPLAVHYECAWAWQSRVTVVVGTPVELSQSEALTPETALRRLTVALENTGVNVNSDEELQVIERLAYAASLVSDFSYAESLKHFELAICPNIRRRDAELQEMARIAGARTYQGIPIVPFGTVLPSTLAWLALAPLMLFYGTSNAPPALAGFMASRMLPDETNGIAFWRTIVGAPVALVWSLVVTGTLVALGHAGIACGYVGTSVLGTRAYRYFRQLSVAVYNGVFAPAVRAPLLSLSSELRRSLGGTYG
jgi:1-acyl-sn-glycerol-3-phosphate acyltransferase